MAQNNYPQILAIFDMDGVVFATDRAKREALASCFPTQYQSEINSYNAGSGGIPRSEKFDHIFTHICPELAPHITNIRADYDRITGNLFKTATLVPGISDFLSQNTTMNWLATSAPEPEAKEALLAHGQYKKFDQCFCFPKSKTDALNAAKQLNLRTVFFGDSIADYQAAIATNTDFVGVEYEASGRFPHGTKLMHSFENKSITEIMG